MFWSLKMLASSRTLGYYVWAEEQWGAFRPGSVSGKEGWRRHGAEEGPKLHFGFWGLVTPILTKSKSVASFKKGGMCVTF